MANHHEAKVAELRQQIAKTEADIQRAKDMTDHDPFLWSQRWIAAEQYSIRTRRDLLLVIGSGVHALSGACQHGGPSM